MRTNSLSSWGLACLLLALCPFLQGCAAYGSGFRELAWADGWQPLPIGRWLLNDGIQPKAIVICPRGTCTHMAVVALFVAEGKDAAALELSLASDRFLSERKARPRPRTIGGKPARQPDVQARTRIERFVVDGMPATRVSLTPEKTASSGSKPGVVGNSAYAVVLAQRSGSTLKAVVAITTDPDMALTQARAAAKDW